MKLPPKEFWIPNWDKVDLIDVADAIILWCNTNPRDHQARRETYSEIKKVTDLFLEGKKNGYLKFPDPGAQVRPYADSDWLLTRQELKSFAKKIRQKPLFLFPQKDKEKKYNIPPKPYEPKRTPPDWEYIKRAEFLFIQEAFEMFFGKDLPEIQQMQRFDIEAVWTIERSHFQIYRLFKQAISDGYFGNFNKKLRQIHNFPLPTKKVFSFIQEKNIAELLEHYGYKIEPALKALLASNQKEEAQVTPNKKPKAKSKRKRHAVSDSHIQAIRATAKTLWDDDKTLTIVDMMYQDEIINASNGKIYSDSFYRKHLKCLAPSNAPGRRPKKN